MAVRARSLEAPVAVLALEGAIVHPALDLRQAVEAALAAGCTAVAADATAMTFFDLTASGVAAGCHRALRQRGGGLVLFGVAEHLRSFFLQFSPELRLFADEASARRRLAEGWEPAPPAPLVTLRAEDRAGARILSLEGGSTKVEDFSQPLVEVEAELREVRPTPVVLDATRLQWGNGTAFARLKLVTARYTLAGGDLRVVGPTVGQGSVIGTFTPMAHGVFPAYASLDDALAGRAPPAPALPTRRPGKVEAEEKKGVPILALAGQLEHRDRVDPMIEFFGRARPGRAFIIDAADLRLTDEIAGVLLGLLIREAQGRGERVLAVAPRKPQNKWVHELFESPTALVQVVAKRAEALAALAP